MFISASEALNSESTENNISSSNFGEAMPALIKTSHIEEFMMSSSKRNADSESTASLSSSMSLGAGPLWWS